MNRTIKLAGLALAALVILSGCMTQFGSASGRLSYGEVEGETVGQVEVENRFLYVIHPDIFVSGGKTWENLDQDIDPALSAVGGNAVRNLEVSYGATLTDFILSSIVPVVSWGTYKIEGEAVDQ